MAVNFYKKNDLLLLTPYEGISLLNEAILERDIEGVFDGYAEYLSMARVIVARGVCLSDYSDYIDLICKQYVNQYDGDDVFLSIDYITKNVLHEEFVDPYKVVNRNAFVYSVDWLWQSLQILSCLKYKAADPRRVFNVADSSHYGETPYSIKPGSAESALSIAIDNFKFEGYDDYIPSLGLSRFIYYVEPSSILDVGYYGASIRASGMSFKFDIDETFKNSIYNFLMTYRFSTPTDPDPDYTPYIYPVGLGDRFDVQYRRFYTTSGDNPTINTFTLPNSFSTALGNFVMSSRPEFGLDISHKFTVFAE